MWWYIFKNKETDKRFPSIEEAKLEAELMYADHCLKYKNYVSAGDTFEDDITYISETQNETVWHKAIYPDKVAFTYHQKFTD